MECGGCGWGGSASVSAHPKPRGVRTRDSRNENNNPHPHKPLRHCGEQPPRQSPSVRVRTDLSSLPKLSVDTSTPSLGTFLPLWSGTRARRPDDLSRQSIAARHCAAGHSVL
uniref:Uncharacterized protein n=1 Tax=Eutreptiella gymnastica TaxID=73025 RepID=A0A7S4GQ29_9EUGL